MSEQLIPKVRAVRGQPRKGLKCLAEAVQIIEVTDE